MKTLSLSSKIHKTIAVNHPLTQNKSMTGCSSGPSWWQSSWHWKLSRRTPHHITTTLGHHTAVVSAAGLLLVRRQQCSWVTTPVPATTLSSAACSDTTTTTTTTELWSDYGHYPDHYCDLATWTPWHPTHPSCFSSSQLSVSLTINVGWGRNMGNPKQ